MATLKDVAARAGVSIAAVSYCINGTHNLAPETRARINKAISELNYIPNSQARNLKRQVSRDLCAIFPNLEDPCYNEFLKGILMCAGSRNYSLSISCSYNDISQEQQLIKNAVSKNYAGLFLVTCQPQNTKFFRDIQEHHQIELVFLERLPANLDPLYFGFDNYSAISHLTQNLLSNGYRDIALLTGPDRHFSESECIAGFQDTLEAAGLTAAPDRLLHSDTTKEGAFSAFLYACTNNPPQAIITSSQTLCQGVIEACRLSMLDIPEDICIMTLDVEHWNHSSFYPHIIRTNRPAYSLGVQSCDALIASIEQENVPTERFHLLRGSINSYPLKLAPPRTRQLPLGEEATETLRIAAADLPTIHALRAVSHEFFRQSHIQLDFEVFSLNDLFSLITEDSLKEQPEYDIYLYDTSWFSYLLHNNCLKDITEDFYSSPESTRYFIPKFLSNCTCQGHYYGFPLVGGTQFLLYRKDLFTDPELCAKYKQNHKLSLRPPKTWKEFNSIARFFTRAYNPDSPTLYGTAIPVGLNEELALEFEPRMWGYGGNFYDQQGRLNMDSPQNINAMTSFMESLQYSEKNLASSQEVFSEFVNGNIAMAITFTEYATRIQRSTHSEYLYKNGYSMIPCGTPANVGWHLGISNQCQKLDAAFHFFHWLYRRHISYYMSILGGSSSLEFPYRNHELQKIYPWIKLTSDSIETSRSRLYPLKKTKGYLAPNEFERIICDNIRTMPQTPQEISDCLKQMQNQIIKLLTH